MSRKDNVLLPAQEELARILSQERRRPVAHDNQDISTADFTTVINLFKTYDLPTDIFTDNSKDIYHVIGEGEQLLNKAIETMLRQPPDDSQIQLYNSAYDYLVEEDVPKRSDIIFVFGGKTLFRPEKAVELYKRGLAPKILVTGRSPIYHEGKNINEAEMYSDYLVENDVPSGAIVVENRAITIPDNVWRSLNLMEELHAKHDSMILITSPYAMRRSWCLIKKFVPGDTKLYRVACKTAREYQRDYWYKQESTLRIILNEFIKLRGSVVYGVA